MATYNPPLEDLTIFDSSVFHAVHADVDSATLDTLYLKYPVAQGAEFIPSLTIGTGCGIGANLGVGGNISLTNSPTASITATNNISMTSTTGNIDFTTSVAGTGVGFNTGIVNLVCDRLVNTGSYNQGVQSNSASNPTTINFDVGCMICSTAGNNIQTLPYTQYSNGFIFSAVNLTAGVINLVSQDINIYSWLRGNVGTVYPIQPNSSITCALLPDFLTLGASIWFVRDDFGYKTINTTANSTHFLNFSDSSTSGVGNIQKCAGLSVNPNTNTITATTFSGTATTASTITTTSDDTAGSYFIPFTKTSAGTSKTLFVDDTTGPLTYNPSTSTLSASVFSGSATGVLTTTDNTATTCYIPFSKTTAGANTSLFLDDTTGPLTYTPSTGTLTFLIGQCARYDGASSGASASVLNNATTGNTTYSNSATTGSISIGSTAMTTGNINIGTLTATGLVNIRPVLALSNAVRTSATASPTNDLDLGKTFTYFGSNFVNTALTANIVLNVLSESFASARFGTYLVTANVIINPTNTTAIRTCQISISTAVGTIQSPYFVRTYSQVGGNVETLFITRVVPIYTATTITLTALCDTNATISNGVSDNLLTFTRIA